MVVDTVSDKMRVGLVLILLLIGFSTIFLGSYLVLTYTQGREVVLLPYPPYSTEHVVTGVLTSESPNFTMNISYYSFYDEFYTFIFPALVGYLEANDTLNFYINLTSPGYFGENPIFNVSGVNSTNFKVRANSDYPFGTWELCLLNDSVRPVNFTIHHYNEISGYFRLPVSQGNIITGMVLEVFKDHFWLVFYYGSSWLYVNVGGGFLFIGSSLGGVRNAQILDSSYILIILGGVILATGAVLEVLRRREG
ncbi:MAG: hypothetical protein ACETWM_09680 [Candidatus Lokiarchaeia archaeon]